MLINVSHQVDIYHPDLSKNQSVSGQTAATAMTDRYSRDLGSYENAHKIRSLKNPTES